MFINEIMENKNITMYRLSKDAGVPYATVNDICSGKAELAKCSAETIYRISGVLGVSMESLIEPYLEKRIDFELFKSNTCRRLKEQGDITAYDLANETWATPVLIKDSQSRSDFIEYNGNLYLFHAPDNRNGLGIVKIDKENLANSTVVLNANMGTSCFYPFVQYAYGDDGNYDTSKLYLSYTSDRLAIKFTEFDPNFFEITEGEASEIKSVLENKSILISGDSIAAGWRDTAFGKQDFTNNGGWATRLSKTYGANVTNAAQAGASFTSITNRAHIVDQLHTNKDNNYDYVVLEGGFNDAMGENVKGSAYDNSEVAPFGEVSSSKELSSFDLQTFIGSLEELFYYATTYFPNAKICFVITYQTPNSQYGGRTADIDAMRQQWSLAKAACEKWGIEYIDLFDGTYGDDNTYSELLDVQNINSACFPLNGDNIHLNTRGYALISPFIAKWLSEIS